jgi:hypothetical protein
MKVKEAIKLFAKFPPEADLGFVGHFGEFIHADKSSFSLHKRESNSFAVTLHGEEIVEINCHDFGPSPD